MLRKLIGALGAYQAPLPVEVPDLPSTVLDSTAYPHILDHIVAHAPHASLLRLRATCRALRDKIDARLSYHLVVWDNELWAGGRHPAFAPPQPGPAGDNTTSIVNIWKKAQAAIVATFRPKSPHPALLDSWESWSGERQRSLLCTTRALDWTFLVHRAHSHLCLRDSHTLHLDTVRIWCHANDHGPPLAPNLAAQTIVIFGWPSPFKRPEPRLSDRCYGSWLNDRRKRRIVINWSVENTANVGVFGGWAWYDAPLVIVFVRRPVRVEDGQSADEDAAAEAGAHAGDAARAALQDDAAASDLETGNPYTDSGSEEEHQRPRVADNIWRGILQDILTPAFSGRRDVQHWADITFVNTPVLPPLDTHRWRLFFLEEDFPGVLGALRPEETLESLVHLLRAVLAPRRCECAFLSLKEYRESVGEEQFLLDTQDTYTLR